MGKVGEVVVFLTYEDEVRCTNSPGHDVLLVKSTKVIERTHVHVHVN